MKKDKKFFICWINDPGVDHDYYEIWSRKDLLEDFHYDEKFCNTMNSIKVGKSFIHFDSIGCMMVVTRIPHTVNTTV